MSIDDAGNVYVTGGMERVIGPMDGGGPPTEEGLGTISYDPDGNERWSMFLPPEIDQYTFGEIIHAPNPDEFVFAAFKRTELAGSDFLLAKYFQFPDCNGNGIPDADDIANGTSDDCNENGIPDECELASGDAHDCNLNGTLDECEIAANPQLDADGSGILDECEDRGDFNGDGVVNTIDLLALLAAWGDCPTPPEPCPIDVNGDGTVSVLDLLTLLANWG